MSEIIFQQKHTDGWFKKRTYYTYWIYRNGHIEQLTIHSTDFIRSMERGK